MSGSPSPDSWRESRRPSENCESNTRCTCARTLQLHRRSPPGCLRALGPRSGLRTHLRFDSTTRAASVAVRLALPGERHAERRTSASPPAASPPCRPPAGTPSIGRQRPRWHRCPYSAQRPQGLRRLVARTGRPEARHPRTLRRGGARPKAPRGGRGHRPVQAWPRPGSAGVRARPHRRRPRGALHAYVKVHCKRKSESLYRTAIDRHIVPALGAMAVKEVRSSHVIELHSRLHDTPSMANHVVAMLSKMFALTETGDLVPRGRNPCRAVNHYREQSRERCSVARGVPERRRGAQGCGRVIRRRRKQVRSSSTPSLLPGAQSFTRTPHRRHVEDNSMILIHFSVGCPARVPLWILASARYIG